MTIELYNKKNINSLKRPTDYNGAYAYDYLVPMIQDGVSKYISNVKSELSILKVDNILIPIPPEKEGYIFLTWLNDGVEFNSDSIIIKNNTKHKIFIIYYKFFKTNYPSFICF